MHVQPVSGTAIDYRPAREASDGGWGSEATCGRRVEVCTTPLTLPRVLSCPRSSHFDVPLSWCSRVLPWCSQAQSTSGVFTGAAHIVPTSRAHIVFTSPAHTFTDHAVVFTDPNHNRRAYRSRSHRAHRSRSHRVHTSRSHVTHRFRSHLVNCIAHILFTGSANSLSTGPAHSLFIVLLSSC